MNISKKIKTALCTVFSISVLAGGVAHADVRQANLYGASAQYKFWTSAAPEFLIDAGCPPGNVYVANTGDACSAGDRDVGVAVCLGDTAYGNLTTPDSNGGIDAYPNDTIVFTYTTFASFEGINAVQGIDTSSDGCPNPGERLLPSEAGINLVAYDPANPTLGDVNNCECLDVTLGASDVAPATFRQQSSGQSQGPCGGGTYSQSVYDYTVPSDFLVYNPIVVPFTFWVNAQPNHEVPFDKLSREMILLLYGQSVMNWNFFDADLDGDGTAGEPADYDMSDPNGGDSLPVVLCLRHAGSGTHATFEAAVLRGDINMPQQERQTAFFTPQIWFNKGSSDMIRCVGGGCDLLGQTGNPWYGYGAIGYADSDKCCGDTDGVATCSCKGGEVKRVDYQGYTANRFNIANGYANFWAAQYIFEDNDDPQSIRDLAEDLMVYASNPDNIPDARSNWWAAQDEMKVQKLTDFAMPTKK